MGLGEWEAEGEHSERERGERERERESERQRERGDGEWLLGWRDLHYLGVLGVGLLVLLGRRLVHQSDVQQVHLTVQYKAGRDRGRGRQGQAGAGAEVQGPAGAGVSRCGHVRGWPS